MLFRSVGDGVLPQSSDLRCMSTPLMCVLSDKILLVTPSRDNTRRYNERSNAPRLSATTARYTQADSPSSSRRQGALRSFLVFIMAKSAVLSTRTTTTNAKKRKSTGGLDASGKDGAEGNKRRRTLDTFFSPQVTARVPEKNDTTKGTKELVTLNEEQIRVLQMVVDEGKNVFFTGAAGVCSPLPSQV